MKLSLKNRGRKQDFRTLASATLMSIVFVIARDDGFNFVQFIGVFVGSMWASLFVFALIE